MSAVEVI